MIRFVAVGRWFKSDSGHQLLQAFRSKRDALFGVAEVSDNILDNAAHISEVASDSAVRKHEPPCDYGRD
jgi:hypothetical protein